MTHLMLATPESDWPKAIAKFDHVDGAIVVDVLSDEWKPFFEALADKGVSNGNNVYHHGDGQQFLHAFEQVFCAGAYMFFSREKEPAIESFHQTCVA